VAISPYDHDMAGQFSINKTQVMKSRLRAQPEIGCKERRFSMSLQTIAAQFTDKPGKVDAADERRVLTTLKMIYEGGSLDGKTANFPTRDVSRVVVGLHRGNLHFFESYKRTIWVSLRNRRTIFRCAGLTVKSNDSSGWKRVLATLRIRKLKVIVI
jgi:hypothetical protein